MKLDREKAARTAGEYWGDGMCDFLESQEDPLRELMREVAREEIASSKRAEASEDVAAELHGRLSLAGHDISVMRVRIDKDERERDTERNRADMQTKRLEEFAEWSNEEGWRLRQDAPELVEMRERAEKAECESGTWQERAEEAEKRLAELEHGIELPSEEELHLDWSGALFVPIPKWARAMLLKHVAADRAKRQRMSDVEIVKRSHEIRGGKLEFRGADGWYEIGSDEFSTEAWLDKHAPNGEAK